MYICMYVYIYPLHFRFPLLSFVFLPLLGLFSILFVFIPTTIKDHLLSAWRTPFSISHNVNVLAISVLDYLINVFTLASFLKNGFTKYKILSWLGFFFSTSMYILASTAFDGKSGVNFIGVSLYIIWVSICLSLSLSLWLQISLWCGPLWISWLLDNS